MRISYISYIFIPLVLSVSFSSSLLLLQRGMGRPFFFFSSSFLYLSFFANLTRIKSLFLIVRSRDPLRSITCSVYQILSTQYSVLWKSQKRFVRFNRHLRLAAIRLSFTPGRRWEPPKCLGASFATSSLKSLPRAFGAI